MRRFAACRRRIISQRISFTTSGIMNLRPRSRSDPATRSSTTRERFGRPGHTGLQGGRPLRSRLGAPLPAHRPGRDGGRRTRRYPDGRGLRHPHPRLGLVSGPPRLRAFARRLSRRLPQDLRPHQRRLHTLQGRHRHPHRALLRYDGRESHRPREARHHAARTVRRQHGHPPHQSKGALLYLPVEHEGALFSCGDAHAAQGDGEVCVTGIECPMYATLRFDLNRGTNIPAPPSFRPPAPSHRWSRTWAGTPRWASTRI